MLEWQEKKYHEVFDNVLATTRYRRLIDPSFTLRDLERLLTALYVNDGNDQGGRGGVGDLVSQATIAAHEQVLLEWKRELATPKSRHLKIVRRLCIKGFILLLWTGVLCACTQVPHAKAPEEIALSAESLKITAVDREKLMKLLDKNDPSLELYRHPAARELVTDFFIELVDSERIAKAVLRYTDREDLSPFLAFSVAYVESDFNPKAINRNVYSTDRGLFQLNSLSFPFLKDKDFFDPEINANYGVSHLKACLAEGKNDIVAIAMYNAGRQRVSSSGAPVATLEYISKYVDYRRKLEDSFRVCMHEAFRDRIAAGSKTRDRETTFLDIKKRRK